jgi:hypothetical protein
MLSAIEQRLHGGKRPRAASVEIGAAFGAQFERLGEKASLFGFVSGCRRRPQHVIAEWQYQDPIFLRPLHQHLASARRG